MAPPGSNRDNHNFDQTAFTIAIRAANLSCLPRETHMMWSVKKASWDPMQLSAPIEIVSRGHRLPKPYKPISTGVTQVSCQASAQSIFRDLDEAPRVMKESTSRHGFWFKVTRVYLQPVADVTVMALACDGFHTISAILFLIMTCFTVACALTNGTSSSKMWGVRAILWHLSSSTGFFTMLSVFSLWSINALVVQGVLFLICSRVR
jgi:hypothetical protein